MIPTFVCIERLRLNVFLDSSDEPAGVDVTPVRGARTTTGAPTVPAGPPQPRPIQDLQSVSWRVSGAVADALRQEGNYRLQQIVTHVLVGV